MINLSDSRVLITGGTGSFGKRFIKDLIFKYPQIKRVIIYSRDELKQWELQQEYPTNKFPQLRFFLGDVRDFSRLKTAFESVDIVIHAAALKQLPAAEYNPIEFIKTNVLGAENIVRASLETKVKKVIALSTDKAASPINLYGASKLCSDKLFIAANNIKGSRDLSFSVVRYGNVMGSRGSVIPFFLEKSKSGVLPITDPSMTRFNITLKEGVEMVFWAIENSVGGEIFVPKIPSFRILDLAEAIGPNCEKKVIGIRPGEKIHEDMITMADSINTFEGEKYYIISPQNLSKKENFNFSGLVFNKVRENFSYTSSNNNHFLNVNELRDLIKKHVSLSFNPK